MATERLGFELKEFNAAGLGAAYANFGAVMSAPVVSVEIFNASNVEVYISIDGTTNHMRIPANSVLPIYPYNKHNHRNDARCVFAEGTQLSIKQVTTNGTGYISANVCT